MKLELLFFFFTSSYFQISLQYRHLHTDQTDLSPCCELPQVLFPLLELPESCLKCRKTANVKLPSGGAVFARPYLNGVL